MPRKKKVKKKSRVSRNFVIALSIVSIIGFLNIITKSLFNFSFTIYIESLWLVTLGTALILETSIKELKRVKKQGLTPDMLGKVTMIVVGILAVIAAILSLPQISIESPTFLAIKGIVSILAVIFIIIQTWVSKKE
jgi:hypothetical protein